MEQTTTLTIHVSNYRAVAGLSLRGSCTSPATARQLEQAVAGLVAARCPFIWVDCRFLSALSWHGQRAIFNAHQHARLAGSHLYWCGFSAAVLGQLADTGLQLLLSMLPATGYQGPAALLQETVPSGLHTHTF